MVGIDRLLTKLKKMKFKEPRKRKMIPRSTSSKRTFPKGTREDRKQMIEKGDHVLAQIRERFINAIDRHGAVNQMPFYRLVDLKSFHNEQFPSQNHILRAIPMIESILLVSDPCKKIVRDEYGCVSSTVYEKLAREICWSHSTFRPDAENLNDIVKLVGDKKTSKKILMMMNYIWPY